MKKIIYKFNDENEANFNLSSDMYLFRTDIEVLIDGKFVLSGITNLIKKGGHSVSSVITKKYITDPAQYDDLNAQIISNTGHTPQEKKHILYFTKEKQNLLIQPIEIQFSESVPANSNSFFRFCYCTENYKTINISVILPSEVTLEASIIQISKQGNNFIDTFTTQKTYLLSKNNVRTYILPVIRNIEKYEMIFFNNDPASPKIMYLTIALTTIEENKKTFLQ